MEKIKSKIKKKSWIKWHIEKWGWSELWGWLWNTFVMVGPMCAAWTLCSGEIETAQMAHTFLHVNKIFQCNSFFPFFLSPCFEMCLFLRKEHSPEKPRSASTQQSPTQASKHHREWRMEGNGKTRQEVKLMGAIFNPPTVYKAKPFPQELKTGRAVRPLVLMKTWRGRLRSWLTVCFCSSKLVGLHL